MRKVYTSIILLITMLFGAMTIAQEGQKKYINYQGVARNADGNLMKDEPLTIGVKLDFGSSGSAYDETHELTTDANGVFSLLIGKGNVLSGEYENLPWGDFATKATVSINGNEIGTTELMAVPHALSSADNQWHTMGDDIENKNGGNVFVTGSLYASKDLSLAEGAAVNEFSTDITLGSNSDEIVPTQKAVKTYVDSQLGGSGGGADDQTAAEVAYDNSSASGLIATTTQDAIDELVGSGAVDADADPTNEIQTLSFDVATNKISLTDGGEITIPTGGTDADADPTNEIQDISLLGTELTITDGSTIDLAPILPPGGTDDQKADEVPYDNSASGLAATDAQTAIDELASGGLVDTDDQALVLTGDVLTIEDGAGSVDLSAYKDETDKSTKTGILIGDGTNVSGLIGTADGQVAKWNAGTSTWEAGTDATGGGGTSPWTENADGVFYNDGLVGIGTDSPKNLQHLHSALGTQSTTQFTTAFSGSSLGDGLHVGLVNTLDGPEGHIYNEENEALRLGTNGIGRLSILGNGNVGIGVFNPAAKLHVDGDIRSNDLAGAGERNVVADANGNLIIGAASGGSGLWSENGSDIFFNGGNVGIGTDDPAAPLVIKTVQGRPFLIESTSSNSFMQYATPAGNVGYSGVWSGDNDIDFGTTTSNATGKVHLTTKASPKLTVDADGNVGIGTTSPAANLEVSGSGTVRHRITSTNASVVNLQWFLPGAANTDWVFSTSGSDMQFNYSSSDFSGGLVHTRLREDGTLDVLKSIRSGDLAGIGERNVVADANGNLVIAAGGFPSDIRLKKDIEELPYGLKQILQLDPKIYGWKDDRNGGSKSLGLIAQEVRKIIPEIVHEKDNAEKSLSLRYTELVPVLIGAVQELNAENDSLKSQLKLLAENLERMNSDFSELKGQIEILNRGKKAFDMASEK